MRATLATRSAVPISVQKMNVTLKG